MWCNRRVARYVAFLRAVNVGRRRVAMATACAALSEIGLEDVSSFVNSGNLLFSATGRASGHEAAIRKALESTFGFEVTTFVRTAAQVKALATDKPFGPIAAGHNALRPVDAHADEHVRQANRRGAVERA